VCMSEIVERMLFPPDLSDRKGWRRHEAEEVGERIKEAAAGRRALC
jgi:hypothetical protein